MHDITAMAPRSRVVIVGAGFAGLSAAKQLANSSFDVTVVDQHNYHLFQPLLYQVAFWNAIGERVTLAALDPRVGASR
jgi:NADH dehydrogenase